MSRADEERANYLSKIAQIRNNLLKEVGRTCSSPIMNDLCSRITKEIADCDGDDDLSSSDSERKQEESKEDCIDLSLSQINKPVISEESSGTFISDVMIQSAKYSDNLR